MKKIMEDAAEKSQPLAIIATQIPLIFKGDSLGWIGNPFSDKIYLT